MDEQALKKLNLTSDTKKVQDLRGRYLLLFANQWSINWALERNEGLLLSEFSEGCAQKYTLLQIRECPVAYFI